MCEQPMCDQVLCEQVARDDYSELDLAAVRAAFEKHCTDYCINFRYEDYAYDLAVALYTYIVHNSLTTVEAVHLLQHYMPAST